MPKMPKKVYKIAELYETLQLKTNSNEPTVWEMFDTITHHYPYNFLFNTYKNILLIHCKPKNNVFAAYLDVSEVNYIE